MDWKSEKGREKLWAAYPTGVLPRLGVTTVGGWTCLGPDLWLVPGSDKLIRGTLTGNSKLKFALEQGDLLPLPDKANRATWEWLKVSLARELDWPFAFNLTWWTIWPGGWCLHGRNPDSSSPEQQRSVNFDLNLMDTQEALVEAKIRVLNKKKPGKVRWYCTTHEWSTVMDRGLAVHGCPECGNYSCEDV